MFAFQNDVRRNDPCPCGSGLKYKKCCYDEAEHTSRAEAAALAAAAAATAASLAAEAEAAQAPVVDESRIMTDDTPTLEELPQDGFSAGAWMPGDVDAAPEVDETDSAVEDESGSPAGS